MYVWYAIVCVQNKNQSKVWSRLGQLQENVFNCIIMSSSGSSSSSNSYRHICSKIGNMPCCYFDRRHCYCFVSMCRLKRLKLSVVLSVNHHRQQRPDSVEFFSRHKTATTTALETSITIDNADCLTISQYTVNT